jgi:hypothetical protein
VARGALGAGRWGALRLGQAGGALGQVRGKPVAGGAPEVAFSRTAWAPVGSRGVEEEDRSGPPARRVRRICPCPPWLPAARGGREARHTLAVVARRAGEICLAAPLTRRPPRPCRVRAGHQRRGGRPTFSHWASVSEGAAAGMEQRAVAEGQARA